MCARLSPSATSRWRPSSDARLKSPRLVLPITQRAIVLDRGSVVHEGSSADLLTDRARLDQWLAVTKR